jgi:ATP-dependent Clp protease ATP-binding subunit ClpB
MDKLSEAGFDPIFGARPLKRTIQQLLENPLSQRLLAGDFVAGDTIKVSLDDLGHLVFQK